MNPILKTVTANAALHWFRRDLRLKDNAALYHALKENKEVLPIFIFDTLILNNLEEKQDRRVEFIHQTISHLKTELESIGSSLAVFYGDPLEIFESMAPAAVYVNHDYEPYARERDEQVSHILQQKGILFKSFKDQVIFDKDEVLKDDGTPYTIFTPYSRKWKAKVNSFFTKPYPVESYLGNLKQISPLPLITINAIGFQETRTSFPARTIRLAVIEKYNQQRDFPAIDGTSRLSVHLRFGTVSIRSLVRLAQKKNEIWLNELIWREFYHMIIWHFPHAATSSFKPAYDRIEWRNNADEFQAWCEGRTGYPIVDAGMRELNTTGFMHNRIRMIAASFLTKHLLIDWRWGEAYFASKLLDFDLAANNGGWQWAAGSGCDAAPYFRVFNPALQTAKFDPDLVYVKRWVSELGTRDYPAPMVDHAFARGRAIGAYQKVLNAKW